MGTAPQPLSASELASVLAAGRRGAFVGYRDAAGDLRLVELVPDRRLTIGRGSYNDLALEWDPEISRTHAHLEPVGPEWALVDDGLSRNGSFVNDERVAGRRRLQDGDVVRLGRTVLQFRAPAQAAPSTLAAGAAQQARLTPAEHRVLVALCRPLLLAAPRHGPATNTEIAAELQLSLPGVKTHIRALFAKLAVEDLPQYRKRVELAERAVASGLVGRRDVADRPLLSDAG
jgi:DNA-binding CsgD family transcriptional regulator